MDQRTRDFLEDFFASPDRDCARLDTFLLHGTPVLDRDSAARPNLRIGFFDFWPGFDKTSNFFIEILSSRFRVAVAEDDVDLAICSCFGDRHQSVRAYRTLYYTGENRRPPLGLFDMAVTFDHLDHPRHFRLPLYVMHAYEHRREGAVPHFCTPLLPKPLPSREEFRERRFCAFLYRNPYGERRNALFAALSARQRVDAPGWHMNNTGTVVREGALAKIRVFARYRFSFAFENESHPGYQSEKILDSFQAGTVPLYWGNPLVAREVNPGSFIDIARFATDEEACDHILAIDGDFDGWCAHLAQPPFFGAELFHFDAYRLGEWIERQL